MTTNPLHANKERMKEKRTRLEEESEDVDITLAWLKETYPGKTGQVYQRAINKLEGNNWVRKLPQFLLDPFFKEVEDEVLQPNTGSVSSAMAAMSARLKEIRFPKAKSDYDFPLLILPEENPNRQTVRDSGIIEDWKRQGCPDFLLSNLQRKVVNLTEFRWDSQGRNLSRAESEENTASLGVESPEGGNLVSLVSASGTGKTRCLFEHAYDYFCIYLVTHVGRTDPGIDDLSSFLGAQDRDLLEEESKESVFKGLRERMIRVILARLAVLRHAITEAPGMEPKHWLALQLFPNRYTQYEVFIEAIKAAASIPISNDDLTVEWFRFKAEVKHHIQFVAIDEAQYADQIYQKTFENGEEGEDSPKRSALAVLVSAISSLPTNIILSGTGLGIESSIEPLVSRAAKHSASARLVGTTTFLDAKSLKQIIKERGYVGRISKKMLKLFSGRPRFGMRLAEALILNSNIVSVADEISGYIKDQIPKLKQKPMGSPTSSKTVYSDLRLAAIEWILRRGSIVRYGEIALELGVCTLQSIPKNTHGQTAFIIREPLVMRALGDLPEADFEHTSNLSRV